MDLKTWCEKQKGRATALAAAVGIPASFLSQILAGKRPVPVPHCPAIEAATGGVVKRWSLRPNDWHDIWPDLIGTRGAPKVPREKHPRRAAAEA